MGQENIDIILKEYENIDNNLFEMEGILFKSIKWEVFTLMELKTIIYIYACINPEWKELKSIKMTAKELKTALCINRNMGFKETLNIFKSIKEKVFELNIANCEDKNLFPIRNIIFSLIGSVESILVQDEKNEYIPEVNKVEITFDEHIHDNILFARNVKKDDNGKIISGMPQYFKCEMYKMLAFNDVYALKLFLELFVYNNIKVTRSFDALCEKLGVKTPRANLKTELRSLQSEGKKRDKTLKKYYDFKCRKLKSAVEEINRCTGMGLTFTDNIKKKKDGTCIINITFNVPDYKDDKNSFDNTKGLIGDAFKESDADTTIKTDNSNVAIDIADDGFIRIEEVNDVEFNENDNSCIVDDVNIDWDSVLNNLNFNDVNVSDNNLSAEDLQHIENLYKIYSIRINISKKDVEEIFINNNKDAMLTSKILNNRLN